MTLKKLISLALSIAMMCMFCIGNNFSTQYFNSQIITFADDDIQYSGSCGENCTYSFDETTGTLTISGTGDMESYSSISDMPWYSYREDIKSVIIENDITSIGSFAFCWCTSLEDISIPDSVIIIDSYAFYKCKSLKEIIIPDSITYIGISAFSECTSLENISIPDSLISISSCAFANCTSLESVIISSSFTEIDNYAFGYYYDNNDFEYVKIENFKVYGFNDSTAEIYATENDFTFVSLGDTKTAYKYTGSCGENCTYSFDEAIGTLTITGTGDMRDYTSLNHTTWYPFKEDIKNVVIEDGITSIGNCAFEKCISLESITLPISITSIGNYAFYNCKSLVNIVIPDGVTLIDRYTFYNCVSLSSILIPSSVTSIGDYAFYNCTSLKEVTVPSGVTSIGEGAFGRCEMDDWSNVPMDDFTIYGTSGSEAETYALDYNIDFIEVTSITNILKIKKYMLGISVDFTELDINSDGDVNILDLITMLNDLNR